MANKLNAIGVLLCVYIILDKTQGDLLEVLLNKRPIKKENSDAIIDREKRSYYPWSGQIVEPPLYESISRWKSPVYQLSRPYFIPIYGAPGRIPIYYPPQPFLINPGQPQVNPGTNTYLPPNNIRPPFANPDFEGSSYLPPTNTSVDIKDKFGADDDLPVWDNSVENRRTTTSRPAATRPTRLPNRPQTLPPLVHDKTEDTNQLSANEAKPQNNAPPPPSMPAEISAGSAGPTNCVWAIVNCCSVSTTQVVESCFEQRGCPGPFWGRSPCEGDFSRAAIESALNYYNRN